MPAGTVCWGSGSLTNPVLMDIFYRYTYYALEFLESVKQDSKKTMADFLGVCPKRQCISTVGTRTDLFQRDPKKVPITDFFGSVRNVELTQEVINFTTSNSENTDVRKQEDSCEIGKCSVSTYELKNPVSIFADLGLK